MAHSNYEAVDVFVKFVIAIFDTLVAKKRGIVNKSFNTSGPTILLNS